MSGASPEDCVLIGDRLAHIQSNYESLQRHALGKIRTLNEGLERVKEFTDEHRRTLDKLQDKEADLHIVPPVGTDVETVKSQLEDFKVGDFCVVACFMHLMQHIDSLLTYCKGV